MSSPREREKRDRRESRGDEREGQGRKRNRNESEETEEIKTFPSTLTHYKDSRPCPTVSQYQLDAPVMKDTQHLCTTRPPPHSLDLLIHERECTQGSFFEYIYNVVTLKIRSRSLKSNLFFHPSLGCICASLVKFQPLVKEIMCTHFYCINKAHFFSIYNVVTLKIRSRSPK